MPECVPTRFYATSCLRKVRAKTRAFTVMTHFTNAGVLVKLVPLFNMGICRPIALESLVTMTRHGGLPARVEIARLTPVLIQLMKDRPDNEEVAHNIIVTLAHSIIAVTDHDEPPDPKLMKIINVTDTLATICAALKKPWATTEMISHAESLVSLTAWHCSKEVRACPSAVTLLIALLCSEDISLRCDVLLAFWRLLVKHTEQDIGRGGLGMYLGDEAPRMSTRCL